MTSDAISTVLPTVSHTDPGSGLTWRAVSYPNLGGVEEGIAARMIVRANAMSDYLGEEIPGLGDDDDSAAGDDDDSADAGPADAAAVAVRLGLYRENLNLLRAIHMQLGMLDY